MSHVLSQLINPSQTNSRPDHTLSHIVYIYDSGVCENDNVNASMYCLAVTLPRLPDPFIEYYVPDSICLKPS